MFFNSYRAGSDPRRLLPAIAKTSAHLLGSEEPEILAAYRRHVILSAAESRFRAGISGQGSSRYNPGSGRAKSRTWGGTRQNRRARRRERRAAPRILPPDGVRLAGGSPEAGGTDLAPSESFLFRWD